jgi:small-conductance mechanosensitive channel
MAKITEDQLEKIKDLNSKLNETVTRIGLLESNKHALLHEIAGVNKDLEELLIWLQASTLRSKKKKMKVNQL